MNVERVNLVISMVALLLAAALSACWLAEPWVGVLSPSIRAAVFGFSALSAAGVMTIALRQIRQNDGRIQKYFEMLCRIDHLDLSAGVSASAVPSMPQGSRWFTTFNRIKECLVAYAQHSDEAEHKVTVAEIRVQRGAQLNRQLESILQGLAEPVIAVDQYDDVILANTSAEQLFQFDSRNAEKRALAELVRCENLVEMLVDTRGRKLPTTRTGEVHLADDQDESQWYHVTTRTMSDPEKDGGAGHGAVAVLRDISGQKAIQKRNAEFVSSVSHEMKTPLAGIKAYVELLADGDAEDEATREEFLDIIAGQADRLQRLVDNLLNLARIEAGVVSVSKKKQSLNELLDQAVSVVGPAAEQKGIELTTDLSEMYLAVLVDQDMILQAAINLLSNAIKYTASGGTITLNSRQDDNEIRFSVTDTGVGLSEEDREMVFEKFYRVKKDKQMASGTGLGLPLAKHIVEDVHGGRLTLQSELGVGSTFTVTLPAVGQLTHA